MKKEAETEELLVKVELRSPHKTLIISINEEFQEKVVIALETWVNKGFSREIKVIFEDETFTWVTCPQDAFIYRTYTTIAIDGPPEQ